MELNLKQWAKRYDEKQKYLEEEYRKALEEKKILHDEVIFEKENNKKMEIEMEIKMSVGFNLFDKVKKDIKYYLKLLKKGELDNLDYSSLKILEKNDLEIIDQNADKHV